MSINWISVDISDLLPLPRNAYHPRRLPHPARTLLRGQARQWRFFRDGGDRGPRKPHLRSRDNPRQARRHRRLGLLRGQGFLHRRKQGWQLDPHGPRQRHLLCQRSLRHHRPRQSGHFIRTRKNGRKISIMTDPRQDGSYNDW